MRLPTLLIALLFLVAGSPDDQQQIEKKLSDALIGKVLTVRGFYARRELDYDSAGNPKFKQHSGPWTLFGKMEVTQITVKKGQLEIVGNRLWAEWVPDANGSQQLKLVRAPELVRVKADLGAAGPGEPEIYKLMSRIFIGPREQMSDVVPSHWRAFFEGVKPTANLAELMCEPNGTCALKGSTQATTGSTPAPQKVSVGKLLKRVIPSYPEPARQMRLKGTVALEAVIGKDGRIASLSVVEPLGLGTDDAAADAVGQWVFRPYLVDGQPVEVRTKITVHYWLP